MTVSTLDADNLALNYLRLKNASERVVGIIEVAYTEVTDPLLRGDLLRAKLLLKEALE